jgi:hypothetical protein
MLQTQGHLPINLIPEQRVVFRLIPRLRTKILNIEGENKLKGNMKMLDGC